MEPQTNKNWNDPLIRLQHYQKEKKRAKLRFYSILIAFIIVMVVLSLSLVFSMLRILKLGEPIPLILIYCALSGLVAIAAVWQGIKMLRQDEITMRHKINKINFAIRQMLNGKMEGI